MTIGTRTTRDCLRLVSRLRDAGNGWAGLLIGTALAGDLLPAFTALSSRKVIGAIEAHGGAGRSAYVTIPLTLLGVTLVVGQVLTTVRRPIMIMAMARINDAHRERLAALAITAPLARLEEPEVQDLIRAASCESSSWVERTIGDGAIGVTLMACQYLGAIGSAAVLAGFTPWLVPAVALPAFVAGALIIREAAGIHRLTITTLGDKRQFAYFGSLTYATAESKEIRVFGLADWVIGHGRRSMDRYRRPIDEHELRGVRNRWRLSLLVLLPLTCVFGMVGTAVAHRHGTPAAEIAVLTSAWSVFLVIGSTFNMIAVVGALPAERAWRRLVRILHAERTDRPAAHAPGDIPHVRFEKVGFTYEGSTRSVLDGLDLEIKPGELLGVVGLNGAGKSTLVKLLAGLYRPDTGRITADGRDIAEFDPAVWHGKFTIVFQDFVRYGLSARDNVTLGRAGPVDESALAAAARASGHAKVVERLPRGWDTPLSRIRSGGVELSGGQWQQTVLTRALYAVRRGARVIVLDEPTAHLDARTEFEVFERLRAARGADGVRVSVVLISHRLSTVRQADRVVLLQDGRIQETGDHGELMALGGQYARLFATQAERFADARQGRAEAQSET